MNLNALAPFDMSETWNLGPRWRKWIRKFDILVALTGASQKIQLNLLLHWVGPEVDNIIDTFSQEEREDVTKLKKALSACFEPRKDLQRLRYQFHSAKQGPDESIEGFVLRLKMLALDCEFDKYSTEEAIKSQIIVGCASPTIRIQLLEETTKIVDSQQSESIHVQSDALNISTKEHVHNDQGHEVQGAPHLSRSKTKKPVAQCDRCGGQWPHDGQCPAMGHTCGHCGKENHYQSVCRAKTAPGTHSGKAGSKPRKQDEISGKHTQAQKSTDNHVQKQKPWPSRSSSPAEGWVGGIQCPGQKGGLWLIVNVANKPIECLISTGSSINVVGSVIYSSLSPLPPLRATRMKIYSLMGPLISCRGKFDVKLAFGDRVIMSEMYVLEVRAGGGYLIGNPTINELGIQIHKYFGLPGVNDQQEEDI
ncbi:uncharacterized protein LOC144797600 [Lissotriton helveticus]